MNNSRLIYLSNFLGSLHYLYQADNDGEWGELRFDFENGTAEIVRPADWWDTVKSNIFAKAAIRFIPELPKKETASKITILANAIL